MSVMWIGHVYLHERGKGEEKRPMHHTMKAEMWSGGKIHTFLTSALTAVRLTPRTKSYSSIHYTGTWVWTRDGVDVQWKKLPPHKVFPKTCLKWTVSDNEIFHLAVLCKCLIRLSCTCMTHLHVINEITCSELLLLVIDHFVFTCTRQRLHKMPRQSDFDVIGYWEQY
jgi:hypothetical protein